MIQSNGTVVFDSPSMSITPGTARDEFLVSPLFHISKPMNQNAPWSRYGFRPVTAGNEQFAGDICFCSGSIYSLNLCSLRPEFGTSWDEASMEKERARHYFHKQLLQNIFGRDPDELIPRGLDKRDADIAFNFAWGSVSACTDFKSGGRDIYIKYAD
jgi:hypothetical protein